MNEKFNKNSKVEQLTQICLSREEEKGLIVKDPFTPFSLVVFDIDHKSRYSNMCITAKKFQCRNNKQIPLRFVCDGDGDCKDGVNGSRASDEANCREYRQTVVS